MAYLKTIVKKITDWIGEDNMVLPSEEPKSIILNFSDEEKPHGCARACTYCNWKTNPLAQSKIYPDFDKLREYLSEHSGFVTISGGGDPLYKYDKNKEELDTLINFIYKELQYPVRIITRERENYYKLRETFPYILGSFSIDSFNEITITDDEFIEYSVVLNRKIVEELFKTRFQCCKGVNMVFREPLQTDYKMPLGLSFNIKRNYKNCEFSTEKLCYEAYYLVGDRIIQGYEIFK